MKTLWMGVAVCALVAAHGAATAGNDTHTPTAQAASMVLTGSIVIKPDGNVASFVLDHADKVPAGAKAELAKVVPRWKFQPVMRDGKAVQAKSPMSVRLVAEPAANGNYAVTVSSAHFGSCTPTTCLSWDKHGAPQYPSRMLGVRPAHMNGRAHIATVYLVIRVGRDGTAQRVAVRRVDLGIRSNPANMQRWRDHFAKASLAAAKDWTSHLPVKGPNARKQHWTVVTPISFDLQMYSHGRALAARYGEWQVYLPGPQHLVPWMGQDRLAHGGVDAIPAGGGIHTVQQTLHLLSSLGGR